MAGSKYAAADLAAYREQVAEMPPECAYLLGIFKQLSQGRQYGMSGPLPLSWTDIKSYCWLRGRKFTWTEVTLLKAADNAYLGVCAKATKAMVKSATPPPSPPTPDLPRVT